MTIITREQMLEIEKSRQTEDILTHYVFRNAVMNDYCTDRKIVNFKISAASKQPQEFIDLYEQLCNENRAQSSEAKELLAIIKFVFKKRGIEFNTENMILNGSSRHARYSECYPSTTDYAQ